MERLYKKSFKRRSMERLYERLIPFGNGGDFFVLGGGALYAPLAHTSDAGGLFAALAPQICPIAASLLRKRNTRTVFLLAIQHI